VSKVNASAVMTRARPVAVRRSLECRNPTNLTLA
jgi:hypothetical protein